MGDGLGNPAAAGADFSTLSGDVSSTAGGVVSVVDLSLASEARGDIARREASTWAHLSAKTAGNVVMGDGTDVISQAINGDATLSSAGALTLANPVRVQTAAIPVTSAMLTGTGAGQIGAAAGIPLIAAVGGIRLQFLFAVIRYTFGTQAYTGGGTAQIQYNDGTNFVNASEGLAATIFTAATDIVEISTHNDNANFTSAFLAAGRQGNALSLRGTAFTNPGSATGTASVIVYYYSFAD